MVRFVIIGIVIAVAFTLYALVDAAMTDGSRARGLSKPVWVVLIVVLPVIGGVLWFMIGKGAVPVKRPVAPDDDPRFAGTRMSKDDLDAHMRDLEQRLRELDDERFPGEEQPRAEQDPGSASKPAPSAPEPGAAPEPGGPGTAREADARGEERPGSDDDAAQK